MAEVWGGRPRQMPSLVLNFLRLESYRVKTRRMAADAEGPWEGHAAPPIARGCGDVLAHWDRDWHCQRQTSCHNNQKLDKEARKHSQREREKGKKERNCSSRFYPLKCLRARLHTSPTRLSEPHNPLISSHWEDCRYLEMCFVNTKDRFHSKEASCSFQPKTKHRLFKRCFHYERDLSLCLLYGL